MEPTPEIVVLDGEREFWILITTRATCIDLAENPGLEGVMHAANKVAFDAELKKISRPFFWRIPPEFGSECGWDDVITTYARCRGNYSDLTKEEERVA